MKIEVKNVSKKFQHTMVLNDVNLTFESGKIYGLIGKNGCGKSVFLKMLCAFYEPTKGEILFDGVNVIQKNIFPPSTRALIEKPHFLPDLTGYENLKLLASIQNTIKEEEIINVLKEVDLYEERDKKYHKYSLGMKQKLGIAQVLMEDPEVLILDEPMNGLDQSSTLKLRNILLEQKQRGKIVILATHIREDIEQLCDIVYLFSDGKVEKHED